MLSPEVRKLRFAHIREALDAFETRLRDGANADSEFRYLAALSRESGIAVLLGPCRTFERTDASQEREHPDALDIEHYGAKENRDLAASLFGKPEWGRVDVEFRTVDAGGHAYPCFRFTWSDTQAYFLELGTDEVRQDIEARVKMFATSCGAASYTWRPETIRE